MMPRRDARLLPTLKLEVERLVAEAGFDPSHFQWQEATPGDMMGEGRRVDVLVYRPRVAKGEEYAALFESDGPSTFTAVFNPGMITRGERIERQNWPAIVSLAKQWVRNIKRQAEAAALLEVIDKARAGGRSSGVIVDSQKLADVVQRAQTIPADARLPTGTPAKVGDLVAMAATLGTRLDSTDARTHARDAKSDEQHREVMTQLASLQTQLAAFEKASNGMGAKDFVNHGISLLMAMVMTAYVGQPQAQQLFQPLLDLLSQALPPPAA